MSDNTQSMALLLESETNFGLSLLREQTLTDSLVVSPLSIALCLSLVHAAANGETRDQIRNTIAKGSNDEEFKQHFANISQSLLAAEKGTQVNLANHVYSRKGFSIKQSYLDAVQKDYHAGATELDFSDKEAAAAEINQFVKTNTKDHIKEIIKSSAFNDDLVAILVNALYFKADWNNKFKKRNTFEEKFFAAENKDRTVDFLHASKVHREFAENDQWEMIQLPYKDQTFAFNVFLPKSRFGLQDAVKSLDANTLVSLISNTSSTFLDISMPKFHIEADLAIKENLEKLGITNAFKQSADLSNMADELYVSKVSHKAVIDVDEDGTTASAATTMEIMTKSAMHFIAEPRQFKADHPFLFVLTKDNHPLFIGVHN